ncbi:MAG: hypothetical protein SFT93_00545 [Rickettsiaceae bacterium]|nr:hypothetical protein [Rickettsiaceae bacterium]
MRQSYNALADVCRGKTESFQDYLKNPDNWNVENGQLVCIINSEDNLKQVKIFVTGIELNVIPEEIPRAKSLDEALRIGLAAERNLRDETAQLASASQYPEWLKQIITTVRGRTVHERSPVTGTNQPRHNRRPGSSYYIR